MAEKQFELDIDMLQNIIGLVGLGLAIAVALIQWAIFDFSAYLSETYIFYAMGGCIILFGLIEMFSESRQLEPVFNMVALGTCIVAAIIVAFQYYGYPISNYWVYALGAGAGIWAIAEWFTE